MHEYGQRVSGAEGRRSGPGRRPDGPVVVFSGGGTGGHLYPALALADALRGLRPDVRAVFVGARRGLEARVLPERGEEHLLVPVVGFRRGRAAWKHVRVLPTLFRAIAVVASRLRELRPEAVVVTGGYAGAPAGLAAALLGVPLVLQEQNAEPGLVTRALGLWARRIHLAFPESRDRLLPGSRAKARVSGNPVRPTSGWEPGAARKRFGLRPGGEVVLVVGGSQGSATLNRLLTEAVLAASEGGLPRPPGLQLLWATGPSHLESVREGLGGGVPDWVRLVGYIDEMGAALAAADLAVSRAGAMATAEFLARGLPAVLVPLPTAAADHQARNARALAEAGAAVHLPEPGLEAEELWRSVCDLASDPARLERMSRAASARGRPEAAAEIAREIARLLPPPVGAA